MVVAGCDIIAILNRREPCMSNLGPVRGIRGVGEAVSSRFGAGHKNIICECHAAAVIDMRNGLWGDADMLSLLITQCPMPYAIPVLRPFSPLK